MVYKTNQVKMKYVVKFCIPGDEVKEFHPCNHADLEEHTPEVSGFSKVEGKTIFWNAVSCAVYKTQYYIFHAMYVHV